MNVVMMDDFVKNDEKNEDENEEEVVRLECRLECRLVWLGFEFEFRLWLLLLVKRFMIKLY